MATITLSNSRLASSDWGEVQPLTTIWTPPPGCPSVVQFQTIDWSTKTNTASHSCAPPNYANVWWRQGYYSPGVCPHKYTTAATIGPGHSLNGKAIGPSETAAVCIPSGYTVFPHDEENYTIWAGLSVAPLVTGGSTIWDGTSIVPAFEIRWAPSDLSVLTTNSPSSTGPSSSGPLPTGPAPTAPEEAGGASSGLSRGAIAGIAVGAVLGFSLILAVVGFFFLRRYRRGKMKPMDGDRDAELDGAGAGGQQPTELPAKGVASVDPELDSGGLPVVVEKQTEKEDAAVVEADANAIAGVTGVQHERELHVSSELPAQESGTNDAVEMDATSQALPANRAVELPYGAPTTPIWSPPPTEIHSTTPVIPFVSVPPEPSQGETASEAVINDKESEIAQLLENKARVNERRRLLELEQLDAEAAAIEHRLSQLQGGHRG